MRPHTPPKNLRDQQFAHHLVKRKKRRKLQKKVCARAGGNVWKKHWCTITMFDD